MDEYKPKVKPLMDEDVVGCITRWESALVHDKFIIGVTDQVIIEQTVTALKRLRSLGILPSNH
jgi:hypothetical protein